jgi:hypothetical protein
MDKQNLAAIYNNNTKWKKNHIYKIMLSYLDNNDNFNKNNKYSRFNNDVTLLRRRKSVVLSVDQRIMSVAQPEILGREQDLRQINN